MISVTLIEWCILPMYHCQNNVRSRKTKTIYLLTYEALQNIGQDVGEVHGCKAKVIAIDIPSWLDCDLGKPWGIALKASRTIAIIGLNHDFVEDFTI